MTKILISAGPGVGKSFTSCLVFRYLKATNKDVFFRNNPQLTQEQLDILDKASELDLPEKPRMMYGCYNKDAVEKIKPDISKGVECRTLHGFGYKVLNRKYGYVKLNSGRGYTLVEKITGKKFNSMPDKFKWLSSLRYIEKLKEELLDPSPETFEFLRGKYPALANMPVHGEMESHIERLIPKMKEVDRRVGIEYMDQVWLSLFLLKTPMFDLGIIDECQDLSASRLLLSNLLCHHTIFVGDENQAINSFAGADSNAFKKIRAQCDLEMTLKTSFRCPPNIVKLANTIHPAGNLTTTNTESGEERRINYDDLAKWMPNQFSQALILCRYNAGLIGAALKLYKKEIPATILGHQLPTQLGNIVAGRRCTTLDDLRPALDKYCESSCARVNDYVAEVIRDNIACIKLVMDEYPDSTPEELPNIIKRFFTPKKDAVTLSTIHKAKGAEKPYIYILFPPVESHFAITPEQKLQERNLKYVAVTRVMKNLYWVTR